MMNETERKIRIEKKETLLEIHENLDIFLWFVVLYEDDVWMNCQFWVNAGETTTMNKQIILQINNHNQKFNYFLNM